MKRVNQKLVALLIFMISLCCFAQQNDLQVFDNLVNKTWKANGTWGDGSKFQQEMSFKYELNRTLVIVKTKGFIDKEQTSLGMRNHGIRKFNKACNCITFWEFDVFGGETKGNVLKKGKDILYTYNYNGTEVTDYWQFISNTKYKFIVGIFKNNRWEQKFLETEFNLIP